MPPQITSVSMSQMTSNFTPRTGASLKPTPRQGFATCMEKRASGRAMAAGSPASNRRTLPGRGGSFARRQAASTCSMVTLPATASTMLPGL